MDIASSVYLADVAAQRGTCEEWVRDLEIEVAVRDVAFWRRAADDLQHLLYILTHDNITLEFSPYAAPDESSPPRGETPHVDCVCLLSGGLDSFSGAAMLLHANRRPLFVTHLSGNATSEAAQRHVISVLDRLAPGVSHWARARISPCPGPHAAPYPAPADRETSRRARSFLFLALATAAAHGVGVREVYLCENGVLTAGLPLTPARSGGLTTRSTHPMALHVFGELLRQADLECEITNPFVNHTKAELIRRYLKPLVPPRDILGSVSCWSAGRHSRQCGGCVPCLMRRLALLSAGLPDEAYMMDVLGTPEQFRGTDAYGNLMDLLTQSATLLSETDLSVLLSYPQLLDLEAAGVEVADVVRTLRRHAAEVLGVTRAHFPVAARILDAARP